jgi:hypothetical protein
MDKQLLAALNKTSDAIEALAEALQSKEKSTSASANALKSGNFGAQLKDINVSLKAIQKDTQEIIKQNKTILALSKKKGKDKEASPEDKMPDEKKGGDIKKGVGTILLIAGAVLAIGLALKIVGKVDFISVIALGLAITLIATAFAKVAALKLTLKEAMVASAAMVAMSIAVTLSSWILKKVQPIGFTQVLTGIMISAMFAVAGKGIGRLITVLGRMGMGKIVKALIFLPLIMPAIALGIALSSHVLKLITPIGFGQALTAILISVMFSVVAFGMKKMLTALDKIGIATLAVKIKFLPKVMAGIAAGITFSSWILKLVTPISFSQAITGILISAMFAVVALNLPRLVKAVRKMKEPDAIKLGLLLPAIAAAITASSWIFSKIKPISFAQFVTALAIAIVFIPIAYAVSLVAKKTSKMKWSDIAKLPVLFTLLAGAITISSHILNEMKPIPFIELLRLVVFSVVLAIAVIAIAAAGWVISKLLSNTSKVKSAAKSILILAATMAAASLLISVGNYNVYPGWKWSLFTGLALIVFGGVGWVLNFLLKSQAKAKQAAKTILILAGTIMTTSHIMGAGKYSKYPDWKWSIFTALAIVAFGVVGFVLNKLGKVKDFAMGSLIILLMATTVMLTSHIIGAGNYKTYPPIKWVIGVAAGLATFGAIALVLGLIAMADGGLSLLIGSAMVIVVSATILAASMILGKGKYDVYPSGKWILGVGAVIAGFSIAAILLGTQALNPFFWAGMGIILVIANLVVKVSSILAKGKYDIPGFVSWSVATVLLFSTFTPLILVLGAVAAASAVIGFFTGANPFEMGKKAFISIAETIVEVSYTLKKGTYSGGPTKEWARGISIALGAFMPIYNMLMANSIMKLLGGGGIGPEDFKSAIIMVSEGIVAAADFFARNKASFENPPPIEWAKGVGKAIGAFAPVFAVLQEGKGWFGDTGMQDVQNMRTAIMVICQGIVEAADFFAKNKAPFTEGNYPTKKWGKGVGAAVGAFIPVFEALSKTPWYQSPGETIRAMGAGIRTVSQAIVDAGTIFFNNSQANPAMWNPENVPDKKWGKGVSAAISAFSQIFELMAAGSGLFTSQGDVARDLGVGIITVAKAIADSGNVLSGANPKAFESYPGPLWGLGVKLAVDNFLKIFDTLAARKMDASGFSKMAKMLENGVRSIGSVASILWNNSKYFGVKLDPNFVKNISKNVLEFVDLGLKLDKKLVTTVSKTTKSGGFFGIGGSTKTEQVRVEKDMGIVDRVVQAMSNTAFILWKNKKYFSSKINPNFMKGLGRNVLDYVSLALYLIKNQTELDSLADKEGNPIDKVAKGMVILAAAYDKLAAALERYARAQMLVLAVAAAQKGVKGKKGEVRTSSSESAGGPEGVRRSQESGGGGQSSTPGVKPGGRRKKEDWEIDLKLVKKYIHRLVSDDPSKPGLMNVLIEKQAEANSNLMQLLDELEESNRREKKRDKKSKENENENPT